MEKGQKEVSHQIFIKSIKRNNMNLKKKEKLLKSKEKSCHVELIIMAFKRNTVKQLSSEN